MGIKVSAAQAAELVDRNERIVRGWIKSGKLHAQPAGPRQPESEARTGPSRWAIDVDELARVPGITIDRERLAQIEAADARTPGGILARLEAIEREVHSLRARLRTLELDRGGVKSAGSEIGAVASPEGRSASLALRDGEGYRPSLLASTDAPTRTYMGERRPMGRPPGAGASGPGEFATHTDAARWLLRHGINSENTPKSWSGWRETPLDRRAVLSKAQAIYDPANWRINWRLHRCGDPTCVCVELLER